MSQHSSDNYQELCRNYYTQKQVCTSIFVRTHWCLFYWHPQERLLSGIDFYGFKMNPGNLFGLSDWASSLTGPEAAFSSFSFICFCVCLTFPFSQRWWLVVSGQIDFMLNFFRNVSQSQGFPVHHDARAKSLVKSYKVSKWLNGQCFNQPGRQPLLKWTQKRHYSFLSTEDQKCWAWSFRCSFYCDSNGCPHPQPCCLHSHQLPWRPEASKYRHNDK